MPLWLQEKDNSFLSIGSYDLALQPSISISIPWQHLYKEVYGFISTLKTSILQPIHYKCVSSAVLKKTWPDKECRNLSWRWKTAHLRVSQDSDMSVTSRTEASCSVLLKTLLFEMEKRSQLHRIFRLRKGFEKVSIYGLMGPYGL